MRLLSAAKATIASVQAPCTAAIWQIWSIRRQALSPPGTQSGGEVENRFAGHAELREMLVGKLSTREAGHREG